MKQKKYFFLLIFAIITVLLFLPFLLNPNLLTGRDNDLGRTYVPLFVFIKDSILNNHQIPLYRPDQMMGEPFVANPVSSLFYPPNLIFVIFPTAEGAVLYLVVHFLIAGVASYYLAKSYRLSDLNAFAVSVFYAFSTKMLVHLEAGHITMVAAFSLFPLVLLGVRKILIAKDSKWVLITPFSLVAMFIAYPTIFYYAAIFIVFFWLSEVLLNQNLKKEKTQKLLLLPVILINTLLLSAFTLFPQLLFAQNSTRSLLSINDIAIPVWNSKNFLTSLLFPYASSAKIDHEAFLYLGIVPIGLFLYGIWKLPTPKQRILVIFGILTLLFVLGTSTPFFNFLYEYMPFLKYNRVTSRLWFAVALVVAMIAGYALQKIAKPKITILFLVIFAVESFYLFASRLSKIPFLSFSNEALYQYLAKDSDFFRVYCTTYCFNPQLITKYNIQTLHGETPIQGLEFTKFLSRAGSYNHDQFTVIFPPYQIWQVPNPPTPDAELLGAANVKYVASTYQLISEEYYLLEKIGTIFLYQNKSFVPRFRFVEDKDKIMVQKYSPNKIILRYGATNYDRSMIISENYFPTWQATVDGQKTQVEKHNDVFRQVYVPKNTQKLELVYDPPGLKLGIIISLATIIGMVSYVLLRKKHKNG